MQKLLLLIACAVALSGCSYFVTRQERSLSRSGFEALPADTPEREARLTALPPNEFVRGIQGTRVTYTYADPLVCHCLYVGSEQDYKKFRQIVVGNQMGGLVQGQSSYNTPPPLVYNSPQPVMNLAH